NRATHTERKRQRLKRGLCRMAGHRSFQSLRDKLTPAQREHSKSRVSEPQKEILMSELRAAAGQTLHDMQIGTLDRIVTSLGGSLEVIAHMPTGDVILTQFTRQSS